jgi:hypothetical protein
VRLREHSDLRQALGLSRVPDYTTLYRFFRRLPREMIDRLGATGSNVWWLWTSRVWGVRAQM